ncbi:MAG: hypothetical protein K0R50_3708 [Eubacterium sp.]|jgi:ferredoxin|nr:hypothetical protein [Eubacterium sp.]
MEQIAHEIKSVMLVYFSGTGGVKRIAETFRFNLSNRGITVIENNLDLSIVNCNRYSNMSVDQIILIFPVHAFDAPDPIYRWIENTGITGDRIAVISVSGGGEVWPNTGCRNNCCRALEQKGLTVSYERMMCMPSNWVFNINDHMAMWLLRIIPDKVNNILDELLCGKVRRTKYKKGPFRKLITKLEKQNTAKFAKELAIDDNCTGCGLCAAHCPVDNIELRVKKPVFKENCIMCYRCIYNCPSHALKSKSFMVLKNGYNLTAVERRMKGIELEQVEKCCKGLMWKPVRKYLLKIEK